MSFHCEPCDRTYKSKEALQQHKRDSPAHDFNCTTCGRRFISDSALQQHLRDAPFHPGSIRCDDCDRTFDTEQSLQQHLRDSPVHAATLDCEACNRTFGSPEALGQHLRDSPVHQQVPETPLDVFFRSFQTFDYDPSLPPATSYARLQRHERWRRSDPASLDAWNRYQDALQSELRMWYGSEDDLTAWHALCRAIGVDPLPQTCEQCERAVRRTHVNIVDLIEWGRRRDNKEERVRTFPSLEELRAYTTETHKVFRNTLDEVDGNVVLRHLLRKLFRIPVRL